MDNFNLRKYLVENKVTTNSKMLKENEDNIFGELAREDAKDFQDLVAAHGLDAVVKALAELYSDAYYNVLDSLKQNSEELEAMLGTLDAMSEAKK